jgi:ribonuclease P protein component
MLPRRRRVSKRLFDQVMLKGTIKHGQFLYIKAIPDPLAQSPEGRFAVVVPKKVAKSSVDRHELKRRIMGILGDHKAALPAGAWILFVKQAAKTADRGVLEADVVSLLSL